MQNLLSSSLPSKNVKKSRYTELQFLPDVLCGCEAWSLILRVQYTLRVFENRTLKKLFGCRRDKVTGEWRKLHKWELIDLYYSLNTIRGIK